VATLVSLFIGVIWGATAGFIGGRIDGVLMRLVDILYSVPFIFFVIMLTVVFGRNIVLIYVPSARSPGSTWRASCAARP
jgi:ABC-type dipeptide/oligopeptide/nickel transport systems, permease components